jgi:hypothetical protein
MHGEPIPILTFRDEDIHDVYDELKGKGIEVGQNEKPNKK